MYDYDVVASSVKAFPLSQRPRNMWRWCELLPCASAPRVGLHTGWTPLTPAPRLGQFLGLEKLYLKLENHSAPTFSYKDRVVATGVQHAAESGMKSIACVSTGNLGNSLAAIAASAGIHAAVIYPHDVDEPKLSFSSAMGATLFLHQGPYHAASQLARTLDEEFDVPFINGSLRPFYAEGAKSLLFEILEQLDWRAPDHIVIPVGGATLIRKVVKALFEAQEIGLCETTSCQVHAAQAAACAPVANALATDASHLEPFPARSTVAGSLANRSPSEGNVAIRDVRRTRGTGVAVSDEEIIEAARLLGRLEGVYAEPAAAAPVAAVVELLRTGRVCRHETVVLTITGSGFKSVKRDTEPRPRATAGSAEAVERAFAQWADEQA